MTKEYNITSGLGTKGGERALRLCIRDEHHPLIYQLWGTHPIHIMHEVMPETDEDRSQGERRILFTASHRGGAKLFVDKFGDNPDHTYLGAYIFIRGGLKWLPKVRRCKEHRVVSLDAMGLMVAYKMVKSTPRTAAPADTSMALPGLRRPVDVTGQRACPMSLREIRIALNDHIAASTSKGRHVVVCQEQAGDPVVITELLRH